MEMAGKLTRQLSGAGAGTAAGRPSGSAAGRSVAGEEGLKAVVAAYEARQAELAEENRGLKASLAALQVSWPWCMLHNCVGFWGTRSSASVCTCCGPRWSFLPFPTPKNNKAEYKDMLNRQVRQEQEDSTGGALSAAEEAFLARLPTMGEEEMRVELGPRLKALQRRAAGLPPLCGAADSAGSPAEQRLATDLVVAGALVADQGRLLAALVAALRTAGQAREAAAQADAKRLAQHYQAQLAAAEAEITRAREEQAGAAEAEVAALRGEMDALHEAVRSKTEVEAAAARQEAEAAVAAVRQEAEAAVAAARQEAEAAVAELRSRAEGVQAELRTALAAAQQTGAAAQADAAEQRRRAEAAAEEARQARAVAAAAEQQQAMAAKVQRQFELLRKNYEVGKSGWPWGVAAALTVPLYPRSSPRTGCPPATQGLMAKYAPGIGAGVLLERAVARKAGELTESDLAAESDGSIAAVH